MRFTLVDDYEPDVVALGVLLDEIPQTCGIPSEGWSSIATSNEHDGAATFKMEASWSALEVPKL